MELDCSNQKCDVLDNMNDVVVVVRVKGYWALLSLQSFKLQVFPVRNDCSALRVSLALR